MASVDAVRALRSGVDEWNKYRSATEGMIDLRYADLNGIQIAGFVLERCDLTGAEMANATLDDALLTDTTIATDIILRNASLVGTRLEGARLAGADLSDAVLRQVTAVSLDLSGAILRGARIMSSKLQRVALRGCVMSHCKLRVVEILESELSIRGQAEQIELDRVRLKDSNLDGINVTGAAMSNSTVENSSISGLVATESTVTRLALVHCEIRDLSFKGGSVSALNLRGSTIYGADVTELELPSAILLDTSLVSCAWPDFAGEVSLTGKYVPSPYLPGQPIQDVKGVPPIVRRQIADAQYLSRRLSVEDRRARRALYRFWGATSAYGQSVLRLTTFSLLAILALATLRIALDHELLGLHWPDLSVGSDACTAVGAAFLGFGDVPSAQDGYGRAVIDVFARLTGFVVLGLWITIASTHLHRLSGE